MRIAVFIEQNLVIGGGFQQVLSIIQILHAHQSDKYTFLFYTTIKDNVEYFKQKGINVKYFRLSNWKFAISKLYCSPIYLALLKLLKLSRIKSLQTTFLDKKLMANNVDIIYFTSPSILSLFTTNFCYIFTLWDLCHRDHSEFPEVRVNAEFESREHLFQKALPKAVAIIADSFIGKDNIVRRYNIDENRVFVIPFLPSHQVTTNFHVDERDYINIKSKYQLKEDYIYYPAQFWAHKNHIYILNGLKILKEKYNIIINAIFSGSDQGNKKYIENKVKELDLEKQIIFAGFVDSCEIPYLYKQSIALVMPTYFGPTNIPPLEAFYLDVPVLYSDLSDLKEQVRDCAFLLDLEKPEDLAEKLIMVLKKDPTVKRLKENGKKLIDNLSETEVWNSIENILNRFQIKLKCWKS